MAGPTLSTLDATMSGLQELLDRARRLKSGDENESSVTASTLTRLVNGIEGFSLLRSGQHKDRDALRQAHFARIETAVRTIFNSLLVSLDRRDIRSIC